MTEEHTEPDPFEVHVAGLVAKALGESKVRFNDGRLLILYVLNIALLVSALAYFQWSISVINKNCQSFNGFIDRVEISVSSSPSLTKEERDQRVEFYEGAKQKCLPEWLPGL